MTERVEGHEANWGTVRAQHPDWCTATSPSHGTECSGDSEQVLGINLGSRAWVFLSTEEGGWERAAAVIGVDQGDVPAPFIYLDAAGLRNLAEAATRLADALEGES